MGALRWKLFGSLLLASALLLLTGCPPQADEQAGTEENPQVAGSEEQISEVDVELTEYTITLEPDTVPAGDVVFQVRNNGDVVHAFEVEGQGIEQSTARLDPGETATLHIENMSPGSYDVYCPVGNHAERGMRATFTVTDGDGSAGA